MILRRLRLANYRAYDELVFDVPPGVVGIYGANGAGKSTLVEAVLVALFGVEAARTKKPGLRRDGLKTSDTEIVLLFEHESETWSVCRVIKGQNDTVEATLWRGDVDAGNAQLQANGGRQVTAAVAKTIGMDEAPFKASVCAEQKQVDAFGSARPDERRKLVQRLLGISSIEEARDLLRVDLRSARDRLEGQERLAESLPTARAELARAQSDLAAAVAELEALGGRVEAADLAAAKAKADLAAARVARRRWEEADRERRRALQAEAHAAERVEALTVELADLADLAADLPAAEAESVGVAELRALEQGLLRLAEARRVLTVADGSLAGAAPADPAPLEAAAAEAAEAFREAQSASASADTLAEQLGGQAGRLAEAARRAGRLDAADTCPTCGQERGASFREEVRRREAEAAAARTEAEAAASAAAGLREVLTEAGQAAKVARAEAFEARERFAALSGLLARREHAAGELAVASTAVAGETRTSAEVAAEIRLREAARERAAGIRVRLERRADLEASLGAERETFAVARRAGAAATETIAGLDYDPERFERLERDSDAAQANLLNVAKACEKASGERRGLELHVSSLISRVQGVEAHLARLEEERVTIRHLDKTQDLMNGFRSAMVARSGPKLSRYANDLFGELTDNLYEELRLTEDYAIEISDRGTFHALERYSGSEIDLANLSLRVAISLLVAEWTGADIGVLILDEVLAALDRNRQDRMLGALTNLAGRFQQILVITHNELVKEQLPNAVLVDRRPGATAQLLEA